MAGLFRDPKDSGKFLVQQRPAGTSRANLWEFPGGKVEPGETDAEALARECREELGVEVEVADSLWKGFHVYADLMVDLIVLAGNIRSGEPRPLGAQQLRYATPREMQSLQFCEADLPLLDLLNRGGFSM